MSQLRRPARVLLVEDNPGDVLLTQEAFEDARIAVELTDVGDVDSAIAVVEQGRDSVDQLPDFVLLDLNLPGRSGLDFLRYLRDVEETRHVPVIVLSSSKAPDDILASYREYANSFITKPVNGEDFLDAVRMLEDYWLTVVRLPSE